MSKAFILCGPSGSGKSTLRHEMTRESTYVVLSTDDILMQIAEHDNMTYQEAYAEHSKLTEKQFQEKFRWAMSKGLDIIVDRTNLTPEKRASFITALSETGRYEIIACAPALDFSKSEDRAVLLDRARDRRDRGEPMPGHVIVQQMEAYVPPTLDEGFNSIREFGDKYTPSEITI